MRHSALLKKKSLENFPCRAFQYHWVFGGKNLLSSPRNCQKFVYVNACFQRMFPETSH